MSYTTLWEEVLRIIRRKGYGSLISRQDILNHCRQFSIVNDDSVDTYRRYLTKALFLQATDKRGLYCIMKTPWLGLGKNEVRRMAYRKIEDN